MSRKQRKTLIPENQYVVVWNMYEAGGTEETIAKALNVGHDAVNTVLRRNPKWEHGGKRRWTDDKKRKAVDMYAAGMTLDQVADKLGSSRWHIHKVLNQFGVPLRQRVLGCKSHAWRGGKTTTSYGYIDVHRPNHPCANKRGYVLEHRLVMEALLGRQLDPKECVHHKNGDTMDNRPDNLELFASNSDHLRHHAVLKRIGEQPKMTTRQYRARRYK